MFTEKRRQALEAQFGKIPTQRYDEEDLRGIRAYFDYRREREPDVFCLDETTWYDLAMDDLFERVSNTAGAAGEQVLYYWLRCPADTPEEFRRRQDLIHRSERDPVLRLDLQELLSRPGKKGVARSLEAFAPSRHSSGRLALALGLVFGLLASGLSLFFTWMALPLFVAFLLVNPLYHIAMLRRLEKNLPAANYAAALAAVYQKIRRRAGDALKEALGPYEQAGRRVRRLSRLGTASLASGNEVVQLFNSLLLLDLVLYEWLKVELGRFRDELFAIHECVGRIDAAIAVASYRRSAETWCEPSLCFDAGEPARLEADGLVHPLLRRPVPNTLVLDGPLLLTGSNASGKSTLSKAAALCAVMAQAIATAPCVAYTAAAFHVYTSIALTDDLLAGESYFITELKAFRRILAAVERGERVFCVIDEVLRGTNTVERIAASSTLLQHLAAPPTLCVAATHDIELCTLLAEDYTMAHFEEVLTGGAVTFDYRLRPGPACTRNAIRLLEYLGFSPALTREAEQRAERYLTQGHW